MSTLNQFRQQTNDPFLWAHLALLGGLPLALLLTMAGLAVGDPVFPGWLEMPMLAIPIISYMVWQQWKRPYYPFGLWLIHRPIDRLEPLQKKMLTIVKGPETGWIALVGGVFLYVIFRLLYISAPLASPIAIFPDFLRFLGIIWALVFFLIANGILQMGLVAARLFVLADSDFTDTYDETKIKEDFNLTGFSRPTLWEFTKEEVKTPVKTNPQNVEESAKPEAPPEVKAEPEVVSPPAAETKQEDATLPDIPNLVFNTEETSGED